MLADRFSAADLNGILAEPQSWVPYPTYGDRDAWEALPERAGLIAAGEKALNAPWPRLPASLLLEFTRSGNRAVYERPSFARREILAALVLAECAEGKGRFVDAVVDAAWSICEESFWGISAHLYMQSDGQALPDVARPVVDLFAAETGALLAWAHYLLADRLRQVSPVVPERISREIERRIIVPCRSRDDFWWLGADGKRQLNNWTPWCCSNWLTTELLIAPTGAERAAAVHKLLRSLDVFLSQYPADGGCDEGTSYWGRAGASLFDCLDLLKQASKGRIDLFGEPLVREMAAYLYRMHIDDNWFVNFADGGARFAPYGPLVYRFGKATGDEHMTRLGAWALSLQRDSRCRPSSLGRMLPALFLTRDAPADVSPPYVRDAWLPETQVMIARCRAGTPEGFFVAAKGGHNAESHNHNDVGSVIVFRHGRPVLVDAGVGTYTAKTFSSKRYEIWTMQSSYHNLPEINGCMQFPGPRARARVLAYAADETEARLSLDLAGAYPQEAGIRTWERTVALRRREGVRIEDRFELGRAAHSLTWNLLTPCSVRADEAGTLVLLAPPQADDAQEPRAHIRFDPAALIADTDRIDIDDRRLAASWPTGLTRIRFTATSPGESGCVRLDLV